MPEFECGQERMHAFGTVFDVRACFRRRSQPMGKLEQHRAELAGDVRSTHRALLEALGIA